MLIFTLRRHITTPAGRRWADAARQAPLIRSPSARAPRRTALLSSALTAFVILNGGCAATPPQVEAESVGASSAPIMTESQPTGVVVLAPEALLGRWRKDCGEVSKDGTGETIYDIVEVTFSAGKTLTRIWNFIDPGCTVAYRYAPGFTIAGEYDVGKTVTGVNFEQVRTLDLATQSYAGAPFEPREFLTFAVIDDQLYLAEEDDKRDGMGAATRALRLDFTRPYRRQL